MRHAGIDDDGVGGPLRTECKAVGVDDVRLRLGEAEIGACPRRQSRVDLDRGDRAMASDDVGEDRAVVAGADADVHDMLAGSETQLA